MPALKGKKILITSGPTWVAIDPVRVISNTASGQTGNLLADEFVKLGAKVVLIAGPGCPSPCSPVKTVNFRFFSQLQDILIKIVKPGAFDAIVHSAAVSDYKPLSISSEKIASGKTYLTLKLIPTPKLIELIVKNSPGSLVTAFKYEPGTNKHALLKEAARLQKKLDLSLVVANTVRHGNYSAYIVKRTGLTRGPYRRKQDMVRELVQIISEELKKKGS